MRCNCRNFATKKRKDTDVSAEKEPEYIPSVCHTFGSRPYALVWMRVHGESSEHIKRVSISREAGNPAEGRLGHFSVWRGILTSEKKIGAEGFHSDDKVNDRAGGGILSRRGNNTVVEGETRVNNPVQERQIDLNSGRVQIYHFVRAP